MTGFGLFELDSQFHYAHKIAWQEANDLRLPDRYFIKQTCDNPPCCRSDHFRLITLEEYQELKAEKYVKRGSRSYKTLSKRRF